MTSFIFFATVTRLAAVAQNTTVAQNATVARARGSRTVGRDDWIRTSDHLHPMQMRYQAALHPEQQYLYRTALRKKQDIFYKKTHSRKYFRECVDKEKQITYQNPFYLHRRNNKAF